MTITVGTTGQAEGVESVSVTVDAGSNRVFVALACQSRSPPNLADDATLGGVTPSGTAVYTTGVNSFTGFRIAIWYWLEAKLATIGTGTKTLTWTGASSTSRLGYLNAAVVAQQAPEDTDIQDESVAATSHVSALSPVTHSSLVVMLVRETTTNITGYTTGTGIMTLPNSAGMSYRIDGTTLTTASNSFKTLVGAASFLPYGSKKLRLAAHPSAASLTGFDGAVFQAPSGGDITGALIGQFTGASFAAGLESGAAVMKVLLSDFGGNALTPADHPIAVTRNASMTTGAVVCDVIYE